MQWAADSADACGIHKDVASACGVDARCESLNLGGGGEIAGEDLRRSREIDNLLLDLRERFPITSNKQQARAKLCEAQGNRSADAARCACDESSPAGERRWGR